MKTDYRECQFCRVRIIFPVDGHGKKMPPVEYGEDPAGTVAVRHEISGVWRGRFLAKDEQIIAPDTRHALHDCPGAHRRRQRGQWTSAVSVRNADQRRGRGRGRGRTPAPPGILPGMTRLYPARWQAAVRKGERLAIYSGDRESMPLLVLVEHHFAGVWQPVAYLDGPERMLAESPWRYELAEFHEITEAELDRERELGEPDDPALD